MLALLYAALIIAGIVVTEGGIWVALHLKQLPGYPIWIGIGISTLLTLKTGHLLGEILGLDKKTK